MPNQNQSKMNLQGETETPSLQSLANNLSRTALLFSKVLHPEVIEGWKSFLGTYSPKAIDWAFDQWNQSGRYFPKPKEILDLISQFKVTNLVEFKSCGQCDEGWVRVFEGKTAGGHTVDPKAGAVRRCECWESYRNGNAA
jgi:hypothetical protein